MEAPSAPASRTKYSTPPQLPEGLPELRILSKEEIRANVEAEVNEHLRRKEWRWQDLQAIQGKHVDELEAIRRMEASSAPKVAAAVWHLALTHRWEDWKIECLVMEYVDSSIRRTVALLLRRHWMETNLERLPELTGWAEACGLFPRPVLVAYYRHLQAEYWGDSPHRPSKGTFLSGEPAFDENMASALDRITVEMYQRECNRFQRGEFLISEVPFPPGRENIEFVMNESIMLDLIGKRILWLNMVRGGEFGPRDPIAIGYVYPARSWTKTYPQLSSEFEYSVMASKQLLEMSRHKDAHAAFCRTWHQTNADPNAKLPRAWVRGGSSEPGDPIAEDPYKCKILRALYERHPDHLNKTEIAARSRVNAKEIKGHCDVLIESNMIRQIGERIGLELTGQGLTFCERQFGPRKKDDVD